MIQSSGSQRGPYGPPGGHGSAQGSHGKNIVFWGATGGVRGATAQKAEDYREFLSSAISVNRRNHWLR